MTWLRFSASLSFHSDINQRPSPNLPPSGVIWKPTQLFFNSILPRRRGSRYLDGRGENSAVCSCSKYSLSLHSVTAASHTGLPPPPGLWATAKTESAERWSEGWDFSGRIPYVILTFQDPSQLLPACSASPASSRCWLCSPRFRASWQLATRLSCATRSKAARGEQNSLLPSQL